MEEIFKIINPMTSTIFWLIIVFIILFIVLWKFALKPVNKMITKRQEDIRASIDNADRQKLEGQQYLEEQKKQLDLAKAEAKNIIEEGKAEARKIKDEIEKKANAKSKAILDSGLEEIKAERQKSVEAVKDQIVDIAMNATEKIIMKNLSEEEHKRLVEESLKEFQQVKNDFS
ncbi:MAG: ATP synthase subunit b [Actinobacteria bacterium ADurb.Bin346]|nr:MAG: ATP synthase subunit b [Actinobacteria bacterium ADurb.Bin346]